MRTLETAPSLKNARPIAAPSGAHEPAQRPEQPTPIAERVGRGVPLPPGVRSAMEARFGESLADVRLYHGPAARDVARSYDARALTSGRDVVFGDHVSAAELSDPRSALLAHELTHVIQHRRASGPIDEGDTVPRRHPAESEARWNGGLARVGLPGIPVRRSTSAVALTATSDVVEYELSYAANDWEVTATEERKILAWLGADSDLSTTVADLKKAGMLGALFDRIDETGNQLRLLHILGKGLNAAGIALVEPHIRKLGPGAELQFNLGRFGVTSGAPAFNPVPLETSLVNKNAQTSRTGHNGGHFTSPFSGVGATGVIPKTRYVGTMYRTEGTPAITVGDQASLAYEQKFLTDAERAKKGTTTSLYSNPVGDLGAYLGGLTGTQRSQQAELLLKRPIASIETTSYGGNVPSRAQVMKGAAKAHNLDGALIAAFILAEQRDQSQAEDAKDYTAAASITRSNTSIGLGQVVVSTAQKKDLFRDLASDETRKKHFIDRSHAAGHVTTANLLASDEYNIFAVARYIRQVADAGAVLAPAALPNTMAAFPGLDLGAFARNSSTWPADNIKALGSEYTSKPWDDSVSPGWGWFVHEAWLDVKASGVF